jgi:hypothetical protein
MAGPINLKLLTDFFNKIGHKATFRAAETVSLPPSEHREEGHRSPI